MADIETALGEALVRAWAPPQIAARLETPFGWILGAFVAGAAKLPADAGEEAWLARLQAALVTAEDGGMASPRLAGGTPSLEPALADAVERLTRLLGLDPALLAAADPVGGRGRDAPDDVADLLAAVLTGGRRSPSAQEQASLDELDAALEQVRASSVADPVALATAVRLVAAWIVARYPELQHLPALVVRELSEVARRAAIAAAIQAALAKVPFVLPSSFAIGNRVHRAIQDAYVARWACIHDVAVERWSWERRTVEQVVIGPITGQEVLPLREVARRQLGDDGFWPTLRTASVGAKFHRLSWLRADLVDRTRSEIWEIKPVGSAVDGVWQEAVLRIAFNIVRLVYMIDDPGAPDAIPVLESGRSLALPGSTRVGEGLMAFEALRPVDVTKEAGRAAAAVPFQVGVLPGLVLYVVMRPPGLDDLLEILTVLAAAAAKEALDAASRAADAVRRAVEELLEEAGRIADDVVLPVLAAAMMAVLAVLMRLAILVPGAAGLLILPAGDPSRYGGGGAPQMAQRPLPRALRDVTLAAVARAPGGLSVTLAPRRRGVGAPAPTTTFRFCGGEFRGVPVAAVPDLVAELAREMGDVTRIAADRLAERGRTRGGGPAVA